VVWLSLVNVLVTLDTNKKIVVYSQIIQLFEIVIPTEENDTDIVYSLACKDIMVDCTILNHTVKARK
jgi:hypothetical protein